MDSTSVCNIQQTIGIDLSGDCGCEYQTRGRPEYEDLCGGCFVPVYYFGVFGGWSDVDNLERKQIGLVPDYLGASLVDGGMAGFSIGRQWHPRLRAELDFSYRRNNADTWFERQFTGGILSTTSEVPSSGSVETIAGMANLVFDLTPRRTLLPNVYSGIGGGVSHGRGLISTATNLYDVDDASFAWQGILGSNYAIRSDLDIFTEYRYLVAQHFNVDNLTTGVPMGDFSIRSHSVIVGLRIRR